MKSGMTNSSTSSISFFQCLPLRSATTRLAPSPVKESALIQGLGRWASPQLMVCPSAPPKVFPVST